ncbi:MAG: carbamoyltransferase HypF, partial [Blastocatellia bacterium]|nr:carbamoyltransferase HypF [Blastocatellia bacterium]
MAEKSRARVVVRGAVQGVGFRPFVYRLATELQLHGWVLNSAQGVFIEVEGTAEILRQFLLRLEKDRPPRAVIQSFESSTLDCVGYNGFEIRESNEGGAKTALILPDIATCADCVREIFDPIDRRFGYPFTNCTKCGPRFSIVEALPYDRANTSMKKFTMCADCDQEYHDPRDRRFHAQPNACPGCGPQLELWNATGDLVTRADDALARAAEAIRAGKILALKGLGGFQLIVDATNAVAIARLRERKHREEKPFAVMVSSLAGARKLCRTSELEERLLLSPESPIVLLERNIRTPLAASVAPANPNLG